MVFNYENNILFSGSDDGSIAFMTITDLDRREKKATLPPITHASEVLVQGQLRDKLLMEIEQMSSSLSERKAESHTKLELRKKTYNSQLQELKNMMQTEDENGSNQMTHMKQSNEEALNAHTMEKRQMQDHHMRKLDQMNREHERKIKSDNSKFDALLE